MTSDMSEIRPLFVAGHAKSGTTLLTALLDGHPELVVFPEETRFFGLLLPAIREGWDPEEVLELLYSETGVRHIGNRVEWKGAGVRDYSFIDETGYRKGVRRRWRDADHSAPALLKAIVFEYAIRADLDLHRAVWWVEKTPGNEGSHRNIANLFPAARLLYMVRDPRANFASCKRMHIDLHDDQSYSPGRFLYTWTGSLRAAESARRRSGRPPGATELRTVPYEYLVRDPEAEIGAVARWLGISEKDCLLDPSRGGRSWGGNSMYGERFSGISTDSLDRWKDYLSRSEIAVLERALGPRFLASDPTPDGGAPSDRTQVATLLTELSRGLGPLRLGRLLLRLLALRADPPGALGRLPTGDAPEIMA